MSIIPEDVMVLIDHLEADATWYDDRAAGVFYIDRSIFKAKADATRQAIERVKSHLTPSE